MIEPVPGQTSINDDGRVRVGGRWQRWLQAIVDGVNASAQLIGAAAVTAQAAAIATTAVSTPVLVAGLYRVTTCVRVTRAAAVSSLVQVSIAWTDGGVAQSETDAALTGNATTTHQSTTRLVHVDANTTIDYATTYASVGAPSMQHALYVTVERVRDDPNV